MPKQNLAAIYSLYSASSPGGAGNVLPDGSIDAAGTGAYINSSGQLVVPADAWASGGWVVRPSRESCNEQRSLIRFKLNVADNGIPVLLLRGNQTNATGYHAAAASSFFHIEVMPSNGVANTLVQDTTVALTAGDYYWIDFRVRTSGSTTVVTAILLADATLNGGAVPGGPISTLTTTDNSAACQASAGPFTFAIANTSNGSPSLITHWYTWNTLRGILVIGDSRMANTPSGGTQTPAQAMAAAIQAMVPLESCQVLNEAIGGTATSDWLPNGTNYTTAKAAALAAGCTELLLDLGANDANSGHYNSASTVAANEAAIAADWATTGGRAFISLPYYAVPGSLGGTYTTQSNALIESYAAPLQALVNGSTILAGQQVLPAWWADNSLNTNGSDGVHPNAAVIPQLGEIHARPLAEAFLSSQSTMTLLTAQGLGSAMSAAVTTISTTTSAANTRLQLALPNAAPDAAGGLLTVGTGAGQIDPNGDGSIRATVSTTLSGSANPGNAAEIDADFALLANIYWANSITASGVVSTGWTTCTLSIKANPETDADAAALLLVRVTNGGSGSDGVQIVNGSTSGVTAAWGSVTVSETTPDTTVTWAVEQYAMALPSNPAGQNYTWEVTMWFGATKKIVLGRGSVAITKSNLLTETSP